jgi:hypothetical protein
VVPENCPACFEAPKERYRIKCLLATQEALFPSLFHALTKTLLPLMEPNIERLLTERRESYGRVGGTVAHVPPPLMLPMVGQATEQVGTGASLHPSPYRFCARPRDHPRPPAAGQP